MLDSHPEMAVVHETQFYYQLIDQEATEGVSRESFYKLVTNFFSWGDFDIDAGVFQRALDQVEPFNLGDGLRTFYRLYASRFGKKRWGEKTPDYGNIMPQIQAILPEAHFIHIIRDGRDVAVSKRHLWFGAGNNIAALAEEWGTGVKRIRHLSGTCTHYKEVVFEELVRDPAHVLRAICEFLGLTYTDELLKYDTRAADRLSELKGWREEGVTAEQFRFLHSLTTRPPQEDRCGRWRQELSRDEIAVFEKIAGRTLTDFGYDLAYKPEGLRRSPKTDVTGLLLTDGLSDPAMGWFARARAIVDELVIFVDGGRVNAETWERACHLTDRVYELTGEGSRETQREMVEACQTEWVLRLDSDEELATAWNDGAWQEMLQLPEYSHFVLPRRWIVPSGNYLACSPWWPDWQTRLFRNRPDQIMFPGIHQHLQIAGGGGFCHRLAIHHHVLHLNSREARERKIQRYEQLKPGGALSHFYRFEDYPLRDSVLPAGELFDLRDEVLRMDRLSMAQMSKITLRVLQMPGQLRPRQFFWPQVQVTNESDRTICSAPPLPVHLSYHWLEAGSRKVVVFDGMRTAIFPLLLPDDTCAVQMFAAAPEKSGEYLLQLALVQESVAWFDQIHPPNLQEFRVRVVG